MSSPRITNRRVVQALRPLLDEDIAAVAAEEHAAIESEAVDALEGTGENVMASTGAGESEDAFELDIANAELRYVVDALARCLEDNERLRGELDAANDAVLELLTELDGARGTADGTERGAA
ncbi:hypothetical protein [Actinophytocola sp.]|uniref:hypothetical protein n=1 Tax=Actinophytocola sp. TaxID=1872138 RepID=UPI00389ACC00